MANRIWKIAGKVAPGLANLDVMGKRVAMAARLARVDVRLFRSWMRHVQPIAEELGDSEARAYTELMVSIAESDPAVASIIVNALPDQLALVAPAQRGRFVSLLHATGKDNLSALPMVVRNLPRLLRQLDDVNISRYLAEALQLYESSPRKAESFLKLESDAGQKAVQDMLSGTTLESVKRTLTLYARAHCGESVQIRRGDGAAFTDGRHIYLPELVNHFGDERDFLVYRVLTARSAGYLEFGTMDLDLDQVDGALLGGDSLGWATAKEGELEVERMTRSFSNAVIAGDLFRVFENVRVEHQVRLEYPGIARDMDTLSNVWRGDRQESDSLSPVEVAVEQLTRAAMGTELLEVSDDLVRDAARFAVDLLDELRDENASVQTAVQMVLKAYGPIEALMRKVDDSQLERLDEKMERERQENDGQPGSGLPGQSDKGDSRKGGGSDEAPPDDESESKNSSTKGQLYRTRAGALDADVRTDRMSDEDRKVEERAKKLLDVMRQLDEEASLAEARAEAKREGSSYEEMADFLDRMQAPGGALRDAESPEDSGELRTKAPTGCEALDLHADLTGEVFYYPEWDGGIEDHKPNWVRVKEYRLQPGTTEFVEHVNEEFGPLIRKVRQSFEALRPEAVQRVRGMTDGDEIDIDRAVASRVEQRAGGNPSDRLYIRRLRAQRDVAVAFLVDMSSSTNEVANMDGKRIIEVEKEALVLIAEAIDAIGDACAIYGFSGYGRDQVAFYVAKEFDDPWVDEVRERVGRISWKMENRDGAAIRHVITKLSRVPARIKLLLILSDGKPLDCGCDHYSDLYAQADTRMALIEAKKAGIHPFCITVDPHAKEYLARMYGEVGYTVIDRVESLPMRLPQIYRRLTK